MIEIVWEESAQSRHEEWALNIALQFTFTHAQSYLTDIEIAVMNIATNPFIGISHTQQNRKNLRRLISGYGYSLFYELNHSEHPTQAKIISVVRGQSNAPISF